MGLRPVRSEIAPTPKTLGALGSLDELRLPGVRAGFYGCHAKLSELQQMHFPDCRMVQMRQVHSAKVVLLDAEQDFLHTDNHSSDNYISDCDGLVTLQPNVLLAVQTADCLPVLLADPVRGVVAAVHAGWRGALSGILQSAVQTCTSLGCEEHSLYAFIGPCIRASSYEVGEDLHEMFLRQSRDNAQFFTPSKRSGHWQLDLPSYGATQLRACGVQNLYDCSLDTFVLESRFASYRRAKQNQRQDDKQHQQQLNARQFSCIALLPE